MTDLTKEYAGELASMAIVAHQLMQVIELGELDTPRAKHRIEMMNEALTQYYQGKGSSSIFARPYAKLEFKRDEQGNIVDEWEAGIEAGMKEAV